MESTSTTSVTTSTPLGTPLLTPWMPGPVDSRGAPVVVSVTEFLAHRRRELPGIAVKGLHLRTGWYAMPGAVGMWLWSLPARSRGGSISVWANEDDLERFIALPRHVAIMQRYGNRGRVRSAMWKAETFEPQSVIERARGWITGEST